MHRHTGDVLFHQHFAATLLEQSERLGLPWIGSVGRAQRFEAGDVELHPIDPLGDFRDLPGHVGWIDQGQTHAVGGHDIALRMLEVGIRLGFLSDWGIDAAVAGIPVMRQFDKVEQHAAPLTDQCLDLAVDLPELGIDDQGAEDDADQITERQPLRIARTTNRRPFDALFQPVVHGIHRCPCLRRQDTPRIVTM
ncbi:hypothetical protein PTW32_09655 [Dechloromonas agitata]|nr:hypothetical protein [Dechloromonas agitata]MDE1545687.1 hypothetical protein [Dechloromonas agitata]